MKSFLRAAASIVGSVAALAALVALLLHFSPIDSKYVVAAASVSPMILIVSAVVALVLLLSIRAWRRVAVVLVVVAVGGWVQAPQFISDGPLRGPRLTVMSSNIELGKGDVTALAATVREHRIDILSVQELTPRAADAIAASTIARDLPHKVIRTADLAGGTAIYSRLELSDEQELDGFALNAVTAVATVPGRGAVRLFALHPVPPTHPEMWSKELRRIESILHGAPTTLPVIALGDYNSTPDHTQFRRLLRNGYRDAGEVAGAGWLPTYPMDKTYPAVVGIDHVLIRGLSSDEVRSVDIPNTDHRAVLARVG